MAYTNLWKLFYSILIPILIISSCRQDETLSCDQLFFGLPGDRTGLTSAECQQVCACKGFIPKVYTADDLAALREWTLTNPMDELTSDPYDEAFPPVQEGVCAVVVEDRAQKLYRLENFASKTAAEDAGAILTHYGPCGLCSSLQDLSVYLEYNDLGTPVRLCNFANLFAPYQDLDNCILSLGFTSPCSDIWTYSAIYTKEVCFEPCISDILSELLLGEIIPYNNPDGSLSPCIMCDEELSGPIFRAYVGRNRRNSGIPSAICRTCDNVMPVDHDYPL
ncbi:MAG: hypothetical protein GY751_04310 [Bacteroidetes bacterium]|nr:hypothetical protein [Bacteroidota bacterium]